jgi:hypothetical protein
MRGHYFLVGQEARVPMLASNVLLSNLEPLESFET